eukprot:1186349-Prorocentrum_minimum.AAC.3
MGSQGRLHVSYMASQGPNGQPSATQEGVDSAPLSYTRGYHSGSGADKGTAAFHAWLSKHYPAGHRYAPSAAGIPVPSALPREEVLDRAAQHVDDCIACSVLRDLIRSVLCYVFVLANLGTLRDQRRRNGKDAQKIPDQQLLLYCHHCRRWGWLAGQHAAVPAGEGGGRHRGGCGGGLALAVAVPARLEGAGGGDGGGGARAAGGADSTEGAAQPGLQRLRARQPPGKGQAREEEKGQAAGGAAEGCLDRSRVV